MPQLRKNYTISLERPVHLGPPPGAPAPVNGPPPEPSSPDRGNEAVQYRVTTLESLNR